MSDLHDMRKKLPKPPDYPSSYQYWLDAHKPIVWGLDLQEVGYHPYKTYVVLPHE